jgi:hypothetical protein
MLSGHKIIKVHNKTRNVYFLHLFQAVKCGPCDKHRMGTVGKNQFKVFYGIHQPQTLDDDETCPG